MQALLSNSYFTFLLIVLGFGFLIFVHELGHFLVAKMVGIKTTQFAIGFGQSLLTWRKGIGFRVGTTEPEYEKRLKEGADPATLGETEYRLNYIPLGGYVKMLGQEDLDPTARSEDPRAFNNKSVGARFAVISAGVIMNIIFGMIFFVIAFMSGVKFPPATVGGVQPGAPAAIAYPEGHENDPAYQGLQVGDDILAIDGVPMGDILDVKYATILAKEGQVLAVEVRREGETNNLIYNIEPEISPAEGFFSIGVAPPNSMEVPKFSVKKGEEDQVLAGLTEGMRITEVDGQVVTDYRDYDRIVQAARGRNVTVKYTQPDTGAIVETTVAAIPELLQPKDTMANLLGLVPPVIVLSVDKDEPAGAAGVKPGDIVASVNGFAWPDSEELQQTVKESNGNPVTLIVIRDGERVELGPIEPQKSRGNYRIGIGLGQAIDTALVSHALPSSLAEKAGSVVRGSKILSINGQNVESWTDIQRILSTLPTDSESVKVQIEYELNLADKPREKSVITVPAVTVTQLAYAGWLAPMPEKTTVATMQVPIVGDDPIEAVALGFKKTHQWITNTYMTLVRLVQGTVPADKLSGPVGIVHQGTIITQRGWEYLMFFLGLISVNLAVVNFLPIPITDGGQAVFLIAEKIKGSPVSVRVQTAATVVGLALLGCVFLFVTYNDITRLVVGQ